MALGVFRNRQGGQKKRQNPKVKKGDSLGTHYCTCCKESPKERRKDLIGINQCAYCEEEGHWKNEWPNRKRENRNEDPGWVVKTEKGGWWWMRRPRGSIGHLPTYYHFPTEAPGTADCGEQANWFPCRYKSYILCDEYKINREKFEWSNSYWSDWPATKQAFLQPPEC